MDAQIQHLVEVGEEVTIHMVDGYNYVGHFQSFTYPYASFIWHDKGHTLLINLDKISVIQPK